MPKVGGGEDGPRFGELRAVQALWTSRGRVAGQFEPRLIEGLLVLPLAILTTAEDARHAGNTELQFAEIMNDAKGSRYRLMAATSIIHREAQMHPGWPHPTPCPCL